MKNKCTLCDGTGVTGYYLDHQGFLREGSNYETCPACNGKGWRIVKKDEVKENEYFDCM